MEEKTNKILKAILIIVGVLIIGFAGLSYYYFTRDLNEGENDFKNRIEALVEKIKSTKQPASEETPAQPEETPETTKTDECPSTLTPSDKTNTELWKTYNSSKNPYTFQYPETWSKETDQKDFVVLRGDEAEINFQFRSAEMTAIDYLGMKVDSKTTLKVACQAATKTSLSGDTTVDPTSADNRTIFVQFKKDGTDHLVLISYKYLGASIAADITEAFDIILKTIFFK